ncbi:activating signal cointegrator 1 complex subunit 2 [Drosophila grimshawi]|uniref:GH11942 n=1 Tax=Drosophila grimshawi TaxID=7222 RepID=B4JL33_DROGR|nr:activating signal cointegrator 1 complex subunit 2 [Drosophila grimshawi]EDW00286.1 GH11942 [Drosophila grimshawi]
MVDKDLDSGNSICNPDKLPLGDLKLTLIDTDGIRRQVPALDLHWLTRDKPFNSYVCILSSYGRTKSGAALEEWHHIAASCLEDFEFLLHLRHHEFWSYMLYDEAAMTAVVTFLQRANPYYRKEVESSTIGEHDAALTNAMTLYAELLNRAVRIIMRLLTAQESATEWITPEHHSSLLYDNYLMSVPVLCDLVIAVGDADANNLNILEQIFETVIRIQPDYLKDLQEGLAFYENAFLSMQIQVDNEGCEGAGGGTLLDPDAETPYDDVVLFALDCAYTLRMLIQLCPELLEACEQLKLVQIIANFYDLTIPLLYRNIYLINAQASSLCWLNEARQQFLNVVRRITQAQLQTGHGKQLVELLQECLSAQTFVIDYQRQYPVEQDIAILVERCPNIKNYKVDFIIAGYQKTLGSCTSGVIAEKQIPCSLKSDDECGEAKALRVQAALPAAAATGNSNSARDIDLEVFAVLDVLPDLGMGFIRRLLPRYDNSEQAIAAILDDNLPPDLVHMTRQEAFIPADPQDKLQRETGVRHYNVHDGDKYDVLTQDNPQCIIKQGKGLPGAPWNAEQLLDDKRDIGQLKKRYEQYSLVEETPHETGAEYDDDYDDSYEALNYGQAPPVQSLLRAKLQQASAASSAYEAQDASEDDQDDDYEMAGGDDERKGSQNANTNTKRNDFCENPEITRARYQQRQMTKYGQRAQANVEGAPKGQGQTQQTTRNRSQKEAHKSSRANHNRKAGAAFKRSKGMMS